MAFISREFAIVVAVYFLLPLRACWVWLLAASLYFYGSSEPLFLVQIMVATAVAYAVGLQIDRVEQDGQVSDNVLWPFWRPICLVGRHWGSR